MSPAICISYIRVHARSFPHFLLIRRANARTIPSRANVTGRDRLRVSLSRAVKLVEMAAKLHFNLFVFARTR